jgi:hypothetical protein
MEERSRRSEAKMPELADFPLFSKLDFDLPIQVCKSSRVFSA